MTYEALVLHDFAKSARIRSHTASIPSITRSTTKLPPVKHLDPWMALVRTQTQYSPPGRRSWGRNCPSPIRVEPAWAYCQSGEKDEEVGHGQD